MYSITHLYITKWRPAVNGFIARLIYGSKVKFGNNFRTDSIPRIIVDEDATLVIGNNVEFKRNIELRVHGNSTTVIGNNVRLDRGIRILSANKARITIGDGTRIGLYSVLNGGDSITIGQKVLISGFVYLQTSMHGFKDRSVGVQDQGYDHAPVQLEDDVWLGTHVVVMPGCVLGKGAVSGSNAVITRSVDAYNVVAGIPAKPLKERN